MADQPQSQNTGRITAMLNDLAAARANPGATSAPPVNLPTRPSAPAPAPVAAVPKPVAPPSITPPPAIPPQQPKPAPAPVISKPPVPVVPVAPKPAPVAPMPPGVVPPARPSMPPPPPPKPPVSAAAPVVTPTVVPTAPKPPAAPAYTSDVRTMSADIGNISTGQAAAPAVPIPPPPASQTIPPVPAIPSPVPAITIPESSTSSGFKPKVLVIGGVAVILALIAYFALSGGSSQQKADTSASPSTSASTIPLGKSLSSYFRQAASPLELKADQTAKDDLVAAISSSNPQPQQSLRLPITGPFSASLYELLTGLGISAPTDLKTALSNDWTIISYGQTERFDGNGQKNISSAVKPAIALISQIKDASAANKAMLAWETSGLADAFAETFGFQASKASVPDFTAGVYRQIPVRYQNYPWADQSLDYAVVLASNGNNYLVISSSRQSMFFIIDQLMQ